MSARCTNTAVKEPTLEERTPVGSLWKEVDPRFERFVIVRFHNKFGEVGIESGGKLTWAKGTRFNGKRGGYRRIS